MPVLLQIAVGVSIIILCAGFVNWINLYLRNAPKGGKSSSDVVGSEERLREIERRLTDVQDVMISLSEKLDRWEEKHHKVI